MKKIVEKIKSAFKKEPALDSMENKIHNVTAAHNVASFKAAQNAKLKMATNVAEAEGEAKRNGQGFHPHEGILLTKTETVVFFGTKQQIGKIKSDWFAASTARMSTEQRLQLMKHGAVHIVNQFKTPGLQQHVVYEASNVRPTKEALARIKNAEEGDKIPTR